MYLILRVTLLLLLESLFSPPDLVMNYLPEIYSLNIILREFGY